MRQSSRQRRIANALPGLTEARFMVLQARTETGGYMYLFGRHLDYQIVFYPAASFKISLPHLGRSVIGAQVQRMRYQIPSPGEHRAFSVDQTEEISEWVDEM